MLPRLKFEPQHNPSLPKSGLRAVCDIPICLPSLYLRGCFDKEDWQRLGVEVLTLRALRYASRGSLPARLGTFELFKRSSIGSSKVSVCEGLGRWIVLFPSGKERAPVTEAVALIYLSHTREAK